MFLKLGNHIINESSIHHIDFSEPGKAKVAMSACRGLVCLVGENVSSMNWLDFDGEEAEALRRHFSSYYSAPPPKVVLP